MPLDTLTEGARRRATLNVDAALQHVNAIRRVYGAMPLRELRRGVRAGCSCCPIAESLTDVRTIHGHSLLPRVVFGTTHMRLHQGESTYPVPLASFEQPAAVKNFIRDFDSGWLPELEL
jgi:hypothetical protein